MLDSHKFAVVPVKRWNSTACLLSSLKLFQTLTIRKPHNAVGSFIKLDRLLPISFITPFNTSHLLENKPF